MNSLTLPPLPLEPSLLLKVLERELDQRKRRNLLRAYKPYPKQREFHAAGRQFRERLLMAGNQLGKTLSAGAEAAMHATGRYPDWWAGKVFDKATRAWVSGVTGESTRDNPQRMLYGAFLHPGTGMIPKDAIKDKTTKRGLAESLDQLVIRYGGGGDLQAGESIIGFKSYDQGREKWQGPTLDWVWFDEEPPLDIYTEGMTRTNVAMGPIFLTFTPLLGMSEVVKRFLIEKPPGTSVTQMTIDDAGHYTQAQREAIIASYPIHQRKARSMGIPTMGSGVVFPIDEDLIRIDPFEIPAYWPQLGGLDFGWDHPSAGVRVAHDRDNDILYVVACHRAREQTPILFAGAVKPWGDWLPWAWPHDGLQHDKGSGEQLAQQYRTAGLRMLAERATFLDGTNGLEAGVLEMLDRMQTGRLRVFSNCLDWFEEFRLYHRKDGLIVKQNDDLLSATRYAMMMIRFAVLKVKKAPVILQHAPRAWNG